jgi:hypothetical protein
MMMSFDSLVQFYPKLIEAARRDSSRAVMGWGRIGGAIDGLTG